MMICVLKLMKAVSQRLCDILRPQKRWRELTTKCFRQILTSSLLFDFLRRPLHFDLDLLMKTPPDLLFICLDPIQMIKRTVVSFSSLLW